MDSKPEGHEEAMRDLMKMSTEPYVSIESMEKETVKTASACDTICNYCGTPIKLKEEKIKDPNKPIRHEIYDPFIDGIEAEAKKRGLKFTKNKKYPIFAEITENNNSAGIRYITIDDEGNRRSVNSIHFIPVTNLIWEDVVDDKMLKLTPKSSWTIEKISPDTFTLKVF